MDFSGGYGNIKGKGVLEIEENYETIYCCCPRVYWC